MAAALGENLAGKESVCRGMEENVGPRRCERMGSCPEATSRLGET